MKIIADENLALTDYFFSDLGQVTSLAGRTLTNQQVQDADALIVRSVTQVNQQLLQNSTVGFVGTATIGTDHLNEEYLKEKKITWTNAAGCNAQAVAEYVVTALIHLRPELLEPNVVFTLGIIGLGNVGKRLAKLAQQLGWQVMGYDPFQHLDFIENVSLEMLLQYSHAISIHVPLTKNVTHATYHLINENSFKKMRHDTILINSARGAVVSEQALLQDIATTQRKVVLDVFEHEPMISKAVLDAVTLVTPHIAGYSLEGKARGTQMVYEAFCQYLEKPSQKDFRTQLDICPDWLNHQGGLNLGLKQYLSKIYDITQDDKNLRACLKNDKVDQKAFDALRKNYPLRREWSAYGAACE